MKLMSNRREMGFKILEAIQDRGSGMSVFTLAGLQGVACKTQSGIGRVTVTVYGDGGTTSLNNWHKQIGPFSGRDMIRAGIFDVKPALFSPRIQDLMERVHIFVREFDQQTQRMEYKRVAPNNSNIQYLDVEHMAKTMIFMRNQAMQNDLLIRLKTLRRYPYYHLLMLWDKDSRTLQPLAADLVPGWQFKNPMNPKHIMQGFYPSQKDQDGKLNTTVLVKIGDQIFSCESGLKKAVARHKLAFSQDSVLVPKPFEFFVIDKVPDELTHMHVLGGAFTHPNVVKAHGICRMTNRYLAKCVTVPVDQDMLVEFAELTDSDRLVVVGKNAFKGHANGVAQALLGETSFDVVGDLDQYNEALMANRKTIRLNGHEVQGWHVKNMPMEITNCYTAYGWSLSDAVKEAPGSLIDKYGEDHVLHDFANYLFISATYGLMNPMSDKDMSDDEDHEMSNSVYLYVLDRIGKHVDFNVTKFLREAQNEGIIHKSSDYTNIKVFDMQNVFYSHGPEVAKHFINSVSKSEVLNPASVELNQYLVGRLETLEINTDVIEAMVNKLWDNGGDRNYEIASKIDTNLSPHWAKLVDAYLNGANEWDGLVGEKSQPKHFTIKGYKFYIPGPFVLQQFIYEQKDIYGQGTGIILQGSMAFRIALLFGFIAKYKQVCDIPVDELKAWYTWYYASMQADFYDMYANAYRVKGFANKVALPRYWSEYNTHEIYCSDSRYAKYEGKTVCMSKVPVLFDKAMHGAVWHSKFGNLFQKDTDLEFATSCAVYVSPDVFLAHQNDCDGDLVRVMFDLHPLPVFTGKDDLVPYMQDWATEYVKGEYDLELKLKEYSAFTLDDLDAAMRESVKSERAVGISTNFMNTVGLFGTDKDYELFKEVRNRHAMMVQGVVAGMKHTGKSTLDFLDFMSRASLGTLTGGSEVAEASKKMYLDYLKLDKTKQQALSDILQADVMDSAVITQRFLNKNKVGNMLLDAEMHSSQEVWMYDEGVEQVFKYMDMFVRTHSSRIVKLIGYPGKFVPKEIRPKNDLGDVSITLWDLILDDHEVFCKKYLCFATGVDPVIDEHGFLGMIWRLMYTYGTGIDFYEQISGHN